MSNSGDDPSGDPSGDPSDGIRWGDVTGGLRKTSLAEADVPAERLGSPDDRSAGAKAAAWASRIMTISLEMVVPGLIGYWLDTKLGTKFVLMLAGFVLGLTAAIKHLLHLTQGDNHQSDN